MVGSVAKRRELWIAATLLAVVLGSAVWIASARRSTELDPRELIPADATGFVDVDLARLGGTGLGEALLPFGGDGSSCGRELESRLDRLVLFTARADEGGMGELGVIASGRLDASVRRCLQELGDPSTRRRVADIENTILVAGEPAVVDAVLVRGYRERTRIEEPSPARREEFDPRDVVRLWVELPERWRRSLRDRTEADTSVLAGFTSVRASIRVGDETELRVRTTFATDGDARRAAGEIERLRELALEERALPSIVLTLARRLEVAHEGSSVLLTAEISASDVIAFRDFVVGAFAEEPAEPPRERPRLAPDETIRPSEP
jgi:hypothetical protein